MWWKMYFGLLVKYPIFLSDFNKTWILLTDFREILKYQISRKSVWWKPSCSTRADGRTDRQTWQSLQSIFAVLRIRLINGWFIYQYTNYFDIRLRYFYLTNIDILHNQQYVVMCFYTLLLLLKSVHQLVRTLLIVPCYQLVPHRKHNLPYKDQTVYFAWRNIRFVKRVS